MSERQVTWSQGVTESLIQGKNQGDLMEWMSNGFNVVTFGVTRFRFRIGLGGMDLDGVLWSKSMISGCHLSSLSCPLAFSSSTLAKGQQKYNVVMEGSGVGK